MFGINVQSRLKLSRMSTESCCCVVGEHMGEKEDNSDNITKGKSFVVI